jgi:hypothetical protein
MRFCDIIQLLYPHKKPEISYFTLKFEEISKIFLTFRYRLLRLTINNQCSHTYTVKYYRESRLFHILSA